MDGLPRVPQSTTRDLTSDSRTRRRAALKLWLTWDRGTLIATWPESPSPCPGPPIGPTRRPGATLRFTLPEVPEPISPLFAAIPLQFIGYYLARAFGANPDQSQDVGDPARFRAAQLLARRGELAAELR